MKFASGVFTLALAGGIAVEGMSIRGNTKYANELMASSRRLEDGGASGDEAESGDGESGDAEESGDSAEENDNENMNDEERSTYFLKDYSIKLLSCISGEQVVNYENGEIETSTVIFRLCPSDSCDSSSSVLGCDEGYGDYAVGINTFMETYMESLNENNDYYEYSMITYNQWGQQFDASEYMECREYEQEGASGDEQQQYYNNQQYGYGNQNMYQGNYYNRDAKFFIGPGCSENGTSIALKTYVDEDCIYPYQGNFSTISSGWDNLPFSDGGLISMDCVSCYGYNEENNMEVSEICKQEYQSAGARCEQSMESGNYYHYTSTGGCDYIDSLVSSVYGNLTIEEGKTNSFVNDTLSAVKTTVSKAAGEASTKFMDTMSTREAQAFIAGMVLFALSFCIGVSFIGCLCVKKRRQRRRLKKKLLPSGSGDNSTVDDAPDEPESIKKRRSSVVALVRSSTSSFKETVVAAVTGSKTEDKDETTVNSDYNNMEDPVVDTSGSYQAPEPVLSTQSCVPSGDIVVESASEKIVETVSSEPVESEPVESVPVDTEPEESEPVESVPVDTEPEESEPVESVPVETEPAETEPTKEDDVYGPETTEESVTASDATEKTRGGRFLSKMDKHLMKRLSVKSLRVKKK